MELSLDRLTKQYGRKIAVDCVSATLKPEYMVFWELTVQVKQH